MMTTFALIAMQILISAEAGFVNFVQGTASVTLHQQVPVGTPVETGSRSHLELLLNPGSLLRLGQNSAVVLDSVDLTNIRVRVTQGEALIESSSMDKRMPIHVQSGHLDTLIVEPGLYRFTSDTATVFDGRLQAADHSATAKKGTQITAIAGKDQVTPMDANFRYDELDMWSQARANALSKANTLALYGSSTGSYFPYASGYPVGGYGYGYAGLGAGWMYSPFLNGYTFIPAYGFQSYYGYPYYGMPSFNQMVIPALAAAPMSATNQPNRPPQAVTQPSRQSTNTTQSMGNSMARPTSTASSISRAPGRAPARP